MPYSKTSWVNNSTPLNDTNLNKIEQGVSDAEPHRGTTAPTSPVTGKLWEDTNTSPATLKGWTGSTWETLSGSTTGASMASVDNLDALRALSGSALTGSVFVRGHTTAGDGGGGIFRWDSSTLSWDVIDAASATLGPNTFRVGDHGLKIGDVVRFYGTMATGMTAGTDYYVTAPTVHQFKLSTTRAGARTRRTATVDATGVTNNTLTLSAHGFETGEPTWVRMMNPRTMGINHTTQYFAIVVDANTFKLATSITNALAGTAVDLTAQTTDLMLDAPTNKIDVGSTGNGTMHRGDDNALNIMPTSNPSTGVWRRVYEGAYNVRWFGAKGDGVTDDTAAVQEAIMMSSLRITSGTSWGVYAPAGNYRITSSIDCRGAYYADNGGYNLRLKGDGPQKTRFTNELTEAYPMFDLTDQNGGVLSDFYTSSTGSFGGTCHMLMSETTPSGCNRLSLQNVNCWSSSTGASFIAPIVGVSADIMYLENMWVQSTGTGKRAAAFTNANTFSAASKFYTLVPQGADKTQISFTRADFLGNLEALYLEAWSLVHFEGSYCANQGSTSTSIITLNASSNMHIAGVLRTENQAFVDNVRVFDSTGAGSISVNLNGELTVTRSGTYLNCSVFGGTVTWTGFYGGKTDSASYYFENTGVQPPQIDIFESSSHDATKVLKNSTNLATTAGKHMTLHGVDPSTGDLNTMLSGYRGFSGYKINGEAWRTPSEVFYYPGGGSTWKGQASSIVASGALTSTTTGAPAATYTNFCTVTVPVTAVQAKFANNVGTATAIQGEWYFLIRNALTAANTADLRISLGAATLATITGITAPASTNVDAIEGMVRILSATQAHVKIQSGATTLVNRYISSGLPGITADQTGAFAQQSATQADPFTAIRHSFRYGI